MHSFWPNCNISACAKDYELKFSAQTKFDTLILNLNSYVQYKIVMTVLLRINEKISNDKLR